MFQANSQVGLSQVGLRFEILSRVGCKAPTGLEHLPLFPPSLPNFDAKPWEPDLRERAGELGIHVLHDTLQLRPSARASAEEVVLAMAAIEGSPEQGAAARSALKRPARSVELERVSQRRLL